MNENERCPECGSWGEECAFPTAQAGCGCARCLTRERDEARAEVERLRALLAEARVALQGVAAYDASPDVSWTLTKEFCRDAIDRIDAALAEMEPPQGHKTCEFCKGRGTVPTKTPWSPQDVLGGDDGR